MLWYAAGSDVTSFRFSIIQIPSGHKILVYKLEINQIKYRIKFFIFWSHDQLTFLLCDIRPLSSSVSYSNKWFFWIFVCYLYSYFIYFLLNDSSRQDFSGNTMQIRYNYGNSGSNKNYQFGPNILYNLLSLCILGKSVFASKLYLCMAFYRRWLERRLKLISSRQTKWNV